MTYKGKEIGIPTLEIFKEYIEEKLYDLSAESLYKKYTKRNWLTKKGTPAKSVEVILDACNGVKQFHVHYEPRSKKKERRRAQLEHLKKVMELGDPAEGDSHDTYIIYKEQMKDPRWLAFREFVLTVRGRMCENCGGNYQLNIHHLQYQKKRLAWEYTVNDVRVLCTHCHKKVHNLV